MPWPPAVAARLGVSTLKPMMACCCSAAGTPRLPSPANGTAGAESRAPQPAIASAAAREAIRRTCLATLLCLRGGDCGEHVGRARNSFQVRKANAVVIIERERLIPARLRRNERDRRARVLRTLDRVLEYVGCELLAVDGKHVHIGREARAPRRRTLADVLHDALIGDVGAVGVPSHDRAILGSLRRDEIVRSLGVDDAPARPC